MKNFLQLVFFLSFLFLLLSFPFLCTIDMQRTELSQDNFLKEFPFESVSNKCGFIRIDSSSNPSIKVAYNDESYYYEYRLAYMQNPESIIYEVNSSFMNEHFTLEQAQGSFNEIRRHAEFIKVCKN